MVHILCNSDHELHWKGDCGGSKHVPKSKRPCMYLIILSYLYSVCRCHANQECKHPYSTAALEGDHTAGWPGFTKILKQLDTTQCAARAFSTASNSFCLPGVCAKPRVQPGSGCKLTTAVAEFKTDSLSVNLYKKTSGLRLDSNMTKSVSIKALDDLSFIWRLEAEDGQFPNELFKVSKKNGNTCGKKADVLELTFDPSGVARLPEASINSTSLVFSAHAVNNTCAELERKIKVDVNSLNIQVHTRALPSLRLSSLRVLADEKPVLGSEITDDASITVVVKAIDEDGFSVTDKSRCEPVFMFSNLHKESNDRELVLKYSEQSHDFSGSLGKAGAGKYLLWLSKVRLTENEAVYAVAADWGTDDCKGLPINTSTCTPQEITIAAAAKAELLVILGVLIGAMLAFCVGLGLYFVRRNPQKAHLCSSTCID